MTTQAKTAEMQEIDINTDVLVIGGNVAGVKAATEIADSGYNVTLIEKADSVDIENTRGIDVLTGTTLVGNKGVSGDFTASLEKDGKVTECKVGAIVVATGAAVKPLVADYGLTASETVLSQSEMDAADAGKFAGKIVAYVSGFTQESNPIALERLLKSALSAQKAGAQAFVIVNNLKVAGDGIDRLYLEARDAGVTYFKLADLPEMAQEGAQVMIKIMDPVLRQELNLAADAVVVEDAIVSDEINSSIADILRLQTGPMGLLQKDNVHLFPVKSNREGIYVAGPSRELLNVPMSLTDSENVALEVTKFLGDGKRTVAVDQADVNRDKCVICLTCYRCCPHGAIYWDDRAVISPVACQGCGICASECPMDAIQLGEYKDEDVLTAVKESAGADGSDMNIVAFCCQNSALEASQMAADFNMALPAGLKTVKVPCAGKVDIDFILEALVEGADGVLVLACHEGNCKSINGSKYAGWRVAETKRKLEAAGFEADRLRFATMASNMGPGFAAIVNEMEETLKGLGKSPMKK